MSNLFSEFAAIQQLQNIDPNIRLVVMHPYYTHQRLFLNLLFANQQAVYVRFDGSDLTQAQLREQFDAAVKAQSAQLKQADYVVLDEGDRAADEGLEAFLTELLGRIPKGRIVLFTRGVPACIQRASSLREQTAFLPVDRALMLSDYARRDDSMELLEVRALGSGRVLLNGRSVDNWEGTLPRSLFFYLVDRGMTTRSQIFETFWPKLTTREATNVFHVTKRKISEVLGIDLTVYWSGFYRIAPNINLQYDAAVFTELIQDSAVASPDEASRLLSSAVSLYQGDFLSSMATNWVKNRRQEMVHSYGEALIGLGKLMEQGGNLREALGLYVRASATNRQREDLARTIMNLYRQLDMFDDAVATYHRLEAELENTLGVSPAHDLQKLLAEIQLEAERVI